MVENPEPILNKLKERRFREYWERTDKADGNERERFGKVVDLLRQGPRPPMSDRRHATLRPCGLSAADDISAPDGVFI